jgi:hypothetical protein
MNAVLDEIANHLEFFGYTIEKKEWEENPDKFNYYVQHEVQNSIRFFEIIRNFVLFQIGFYRDELPTSALAETFNELNRKSTLAKFYYTLDKDSSRIFVYMEAIFMGDYTKQSFGIFYDRFKAEEKNAFQSDAYKNCFITKEQPSCTVQ